MSSGKPGSKLGAANRMWRHTKTAPTAAKQKGLFALGVSYYRKLSDKKPIRKFSCDVDFSPAFGLGGLYQSKAAAEVDITSFREAVDFQNERPGQGGSRSAKQCLSPVPCARQGLRTVQSTSPDKAAVQAEVQHVVDGMLITIERFAKREQRTKSAKQKEFFLPRGHAGGEVTTRGKRMGRYVKRADLRAKMVRRKLMQTVNEGKKAAIVLDWMNWRNKVIAYLGGHIRNTTVHKLLSADVADPHDVSVKQMALVTRKAIAVRNFMMLMNKRENFDPDEQNPQVHPQSRKQVPF
jgi:hypothetical protein